MKEQPYKDQTALLLDVLPDVAKEKCFAMHGGTAINLFIRDMPRVSVDIDLTYVPIEDRATSLTKTAEALERIKADLETKRAAIRVDHKQDIAKLLISTKEAAIKLEVNLVGRGTIEPPQTMVLCDKAQDEFEVFAEMPVVPMGQLYGGKICAALDRQHPRDLFDVKYLLDHDGFTDEIKTGFLLCLLSSDRPIHEIIRPHLLDQRATMINQFEGMSEDIFTYKGFESTRRELIDTIHKNLKARDKDFLLSVKALEPDWSIYDFERFPAVQWKMLNLEKLKDTNPGKHQRQYDALEERLRA
jgi:predicted nucleotidyltransferase component of viral defense system